MRSLCLLAFGCLVGLIVATYDLKIKTRALESKAQDLVSLMQDEGDFLSLMRAERSHLSRPDRIEEMARKTLHLEALSAAQVVPWSAFRPSSSTWRAQVSATPRLEGIAALIERSSARTAEVLSR